MERQIGAVLARTFRELCEKSNKTAKKEFYKISLQEIKDIEKILRKVDNKNFDLVKELGTYFSFE